MAERPPSTVAARCKASFSGGRCVDIPANLRHIDGIRQCVVDDRPSVRLRSGMPKGQRPEHPAEAKEALGKSLAAARKAAGFSLDTASAALAEAGTPIGRAAIGHWETGTNVVDALWLRRLARLYNTTSDALLGIKQAPEAIWPLSRELHSEVVGMKPEDLRFMEVALWTHLRKVAPSELHYYTDERKASAPPSAPQLLHLGNSSQAGRKKAS